MVNKFRKIRTITLTLFTWIIFATTGAQTTDLAPVRVVIEEAEIEPVMVSSPPPKVEEIIEEPPAVEEELLTQEEIELIALVTMAEAEGEPEEGQRLVIDTILNRVDSDLPYFPDTVHDVVYQKNAFSSMWDGRADRCYVMEELCQLVREELQNRTNHEVLYFTAGEYGKYGTPVFRVANHYFCEA